MIGIDEAREWLAANAPDWQLVRAQTTLLPGATVGSPTEQTVEVALVERMAPENRLPWQSDVTLVGNGATILDAVQRAIGGFRDVK